MSAIQKTELNFGVDKSILRNLILQQSGSLKKAITELVMNEIDAGADEISIEISDDGRNLIVSGNGRGFVTLEDIKKHFGTFGFSHETEDELALGRKYGRYGLGRGQIFAFGGSTWETNEFKMMVDFKSWDPKQQDLPYIVETHPKTLHKGCKITIQLYKAMAFWERKDIEREICQMLEYAPQNIKLNGKLLNTPPDSVSWTKTEQHLRIKVSSSTNGLRIYNDGIFIMTIPHSKFGISGDLTSVGKNFDVNMARNDIQQTTCELWPLIKPFVSDLVEKKRKKALSKEDREHLWREFFSGNIDVQEMMKLPIVPIVSEKYTTMIKMIDHASGCVTLAPVAYSATGDRIHAVNMAAVLSPDLLNALNFFSVEDFIQSIQSVIDVKISLMIQKNGGHQTSESYELNKIKKQINNIKIVSFGLLRDEFNDRSVIIDDKKLTPLQKCYLKAVNSLNRNIAKITGQAPRKIVLGESETAQGWTDGRSYIALNERRVDGLFTKGYDNIYKVMLILLHEYAHDNSSTSDHPHDLDFYKRYHDWDMNLSMSKHGIANIAFKTYITARKNAGFKMLSREFEAMLGGMGEYFLKGINGTLDGIEFEEDETDVENATSS